MIRENNCLQKKKKMEFLAIEERKVDCWNLSENVIVSYIKYHFYKPRQNQM